MKQYTCIGCWDLFDDSEIQEWADCGEDFTDASDDNETVICPDCTDLLWHLDPADRIKTLLKWRDDYDERHTAH